MKIKKRKKIMEQQIKDSIQQIIDEFKIETEISVCEINIKFGTIHDEHGEPVPVLGSVKVKLDI